MRKPEPKPPELPEHDGRIADETEMKVLARSTPEAPQPWGPMFSQFWQEHEPSLLVDKAEVTDADRERFAEYLEDIKRGNIQTTHKDDFKEFTEFHRLRRQELRRLAWLIEHDVLAGKALEAATRRLGIYRERGYDEGDSK